MANDLKEMTRAELRELASERGIPRASSMNKAELIEHLARDERWRTMKRESLEDEARSLGVVETQDLRKPELIERLHLADQQSEAVEDQVMEPSAAPEVFYVAKTRPGLGRLLQVSGYAGLIFSLAIAVGLPLTAVRTTPGLEARIGNLTGRLESVAELLDSTAGALENAAGALDDTSVGLETTEVALANTEPLLGSVSELLGTQAPETIRSTRSALLSAQDGARAMDRVLRGLSLLGLDYNPDVPLDESLAQTAASLEPLPRALEQVESDLETVQGDLELLRGDLDTVASDLDELSETLSPLGEDLKAQSDSLTAIAAILDDLGSGLSTQLLAVALVGSLLAVWVAAGQAGLIVIGGWLQEGVPVRIDE